MMRRMIVGGLEGKLRKRGEKDILDWRVKIGFAWGEKDDQDSF